MLSVAMVSSMVACSGETGSTEPAPSSEAQSAATDDSEEPVEELGYTFGLNETFYSEEPVTYTMAFSDAAWYPLTEQWETEGVFAKIKERTNVTLELTSIDSNDYNDKIALSVTAGDAPYIIPKIYDESRYVDGGAIVPVSKWTDFMPNFTNFVETYDMQADLDTIRRNDGNFYRLPGMLEKPLQDYTLMIRKDLFEAAGVDVPAMEKDWTWEDLYDALVKVKAYMVAEGMCSESDYIWSDLWCGAESGQNSGGNLLKLMGYTYGVASGWAVGDCMQYDSASDSWYLSSTTEDYKEFVTMANKFVAGGILDPETFTQDDATATNKFYRGETAIISTNRGQIATMESSLRDSLGEGNYATYLCVIPQGTNATMAENTRLENGVMITSKAYEELGWKAEKTIEDVEKSFSDDVNKSNAIAYISGTNTLITQLSYLKIYEDVRIRPSNIAPNNGGADRTQLAQTNDGESANGRAGRGDGSAALSVGENRSTKDAGNSNGREDSSREPDLFSGTQSNREVSIEEPAMVGIPATGGYTRGGGSNRSNGGNGQRRGRVNGGKNISTDAERTSSTDSLDAELDAALERFKKTLSVFKSAGSDTLNLNIAGLNSRQLEILPNLISEGTKVGYILVKKGIQQINQWVQSMRSYIAMPLSDAGLSDAEIDAFIMELWNSRLPIGDEVHTISEWASIIGMEATRDAVKSVIIDKKAEQDAAENIKVVVGDANNIAETLPFLLPQQQEDVLKAETQFFDNTHADREHAYGKG